METQIEDANGLWEDSTKIQFACETADQIINRMIELFDMEAQVYSLDKDGNVICSDEEPTGYTEEGRELFEHIYSLCRFD